MLFSSYYHGLTTIYLLCEVLQSVTDKNQIKRNRRFCIKQKVKLEWGRPSLDSIRECRVDCVLTDVMWFSPSEDDCSLTPAAAGPVSLSLILTSTTNWWFLFYLQIHIQTFTAVHTFDYVDVARVSDNTAAVCYNKHHPRHLNLYVTRLSGRYYTIRQHFLTIISFTGSRLLTEWISYKVADLVYQPMSIWFGTNELWQPANTEARQWLHSDIHFLLNIGDVM